MAERPRALNSMNVVQQTIPMMSFAQAMLDRSPGFADRVCWYEREFGTVDDDTLAVLSQANHFCWFEVEYVQDYLDVCRAIGAGKPTSLYLCRQVTPERWAEMNSYVIGVQQWLGVKAPVPRETSKRKVGQITGWLGHPTPRKEALAELYVCHLVMDHLLRLSLTRLSGTEDPDEGWYADFTPWYRTSDGTRLTVEGRDRLIGELVERVREGMYSAPEGSEDLVTNILKESPPPCQHRFSRYQDIKISSIGALSWRGAVPPDSEAPKYAARDWFEEACLDGWLAGDLPETELMTALYAALGTPTQRKKAIIRDFFHGPREPVLWNWLEEDAQARSITAAAVFQPAGASMRTTESITDGLLRPDSPTLNTGKETEAGT